MSVEQTGHATPGKWFVDENDPSRVLARVDGGFLVCIAVGCREANARLIVEAHNNNSIRSGREALKKALSELDAVLEGREKGCN